MVRVFLYHRIARLSLFLKEALLVLASLYVLTRSLSVTWIVYLMTKVVLLLSALIRLLLVLVYEHRIFSSHLLLDHRTLLVLQSVLLRTMNSITNSSRAMLSSLVLQKELSFEYQTNLVRTHFRQAHSTTTSTISAMTLYCTTSRDRSPSTTEPMYLPWQWVMPIKVATTTLSNSIPSNLMLMRIQATKKDCRITDITSYTTHRMGISYSGMKLILSG